VVLAVSHQSKNTKRRGGVVGGVNAELEPSVRHLFRHGRHVAWRIAKKTGIRPPGLREANRVGFFCGRKRARKSGDHGNGREECITHKHSRGFHCYCYSSGTKK